MDLVAHEQVRVDETYELAEEQAKALEDRLGPWHEAFDQGRAQGLSGPQRERLHALRDTLDGDSLLVAGRVDLVDDAVFDTPTVYLTRVHVSGQLRDGAEFLAFAAPAAGEYFYKVSRQSPHESVARKRVILGHKRKVTDVEDLVFSALPQDASVAIPEPQVDADPLLTHLRHTVADGTMHDVVATIAADQYRLMELPFDEVLLVQGGPGTGKTVVGLHRIAVQLYRLDGIAAEDVLFTGPNAIFLRYASQVLPDLGRGTVVQRAVHTLVDEDVDVTATDPAATRAVKGSARMAAVIANHLEQRISPPEDDVYVGSRLVVAERVAELVAQARQSPGTYDARRRRFITLLENEFSTKYDRPIEEIKIGDHARDFENAVNRIWEQLSARETVRRLLQGRLLLADASKDLLKDEERALLLRPPTDTVGEAVWSVADLALLDEARAQLTGVARRFRHAVVDEAQNISPMELRVIARRTHEGALTILGDLNQATEPWAAASWQEHLAGTGITPTTIESLNLCYRIPNPLLRPATVLAEHRIDVDVPVTTSILRDGPDPVLVEATPDDLRPRLTDLVNTLSTSDGTLGVITVDERVHTLLAALEAAGIDAHPAQEGLGQPVTIISVNDANGIEFDHVLIVEPHEILTAHPVTGPRALFVSLTRARRSTTVLHSMPLPAALTSAAMKTPPSMEVPATPIEVPRATQATPDETVSLSDIVAGQAGVSVTGRTHVEYRSAGRYLTRMEIDTTGGTVVVEVVNTETLKSARLARGQLVETDSGLSALLVRNESEPPSYLEAPDPVSLGQKVWQVLLG